MTNIREQILTEASNNVQIDRNADYDTPERNFERIAALANVALERAFARGYLLPHEVGTFMICVKLARIVTSPGKRDHWVDLAGYAACAAECVLVDSDDPQEGRG